MRIVHTADWQHGRPFVRFERHLRAARGEAGLDAIDRISAQLLNNGATHTPTDVEIDLAAGPDELKALFARLVGVRWAGTPRSECRRSSSTASISPSGIFIACNSGSWKRQSDASR